MDKGYEVYDDQSEDFIVVVSEARSQVNEIISNMSGTSQPGIADKMKRTMSYVYNQSSDTVKTLSLPPDRISCRKCSVPIDIDISLFSWPCKDCGATNSAEAVKCIYCPSESKSNIPSRVSVLCPSCDTGNDVRSSRFVHQIDQVAQVASLAVSNVADAASREYNRQIGVPETFSCSKCNASLRNPNFTEIAGAQVEQVMKVTCGVCNQVSSVPVSRFESSLTRWLYSMGRLGYRLMYIFRNGYADCPMCSNPVPLPKRQTDQAFVSAVLKCESCKNEFTFSSAPNVEEM